MIEYIVTTKAKFYIKRSGNMGFIEEKSHERFNPKKTDFIVYRGKNEIKAKYIALKTHYNLCVERGESNEYGMVMLYMDIKFYEEQYPEWCI